MKRHPIITLAIATFLSVPLLIFILHTEDSNRLNFKYLSWKIGLGSYDATYAQHVISDVKFREKLEGKTMDEVKGYFPDLRKSENANDYQRNYIPQITDNDCFWIGDSAMTVVFKGGKLESFRLWKG